MRLLICVVGVQFLALLLYLFGPVQYPDYQHTAEIVFYVLLYVVSLIAGGLAATNLHLRPKRSLNLDPSLFVTAAASVTLLTIGFSIALTGLGLGQSMGEAYEVSQQAGTSRASQLLGYFRIATSALLVGLLPVTFLMYRDLSPKAKYLAWAAILSYVGATVLFGVNRYIFDVIITILGSLLITGRSLIAVLNVNRRKVLILFLLLPAALVLFTDSQITRFGSAAISGSNPRTGAEYQFSEADGRLAVLATSFSSYISQGFRAFELALELEPRWTYGVGHSTFLSRQVDRIAGSDIEASSYPARIETFGWDRYVDWSTAYVWFASDLTFPGVAVLMFFTGLTYRTLENSFKRSPNPVFAAMIGQYWVGMFYLSANNQIFQSGERAVAFLLISLVLIGSTNLMKRRS